jgi:AraC family carnitine catabolism transcriptional activator
MANVDAQEFHFLLLPEFSVMGFASAVEPLRVANRFQPDAYRWKILSLDGGAVRASNGMSLNVDAALASAQAVQTLFVVAGFNPLRHHQSALGEALRQLDRQGATLGAIDTGAFVLAQARLLRGHPVSLHWEAQSAFKERFPALTVTQELFEWGERRVSCAGGTAAMDMVLALIGQRHGQSLAATVSEQFLHGPVRSPSEHQRTEVIARFGVHDKKLVQAIQAMQAHLEEVIGTPALAATLGVTRRQMERLFAAHLQVSPAAFYLGLRLDRARQLLQQSDMSVMAIAVACGFASPSHFSRAYRRRFGVRPKDERARRS